MHHTQITFQWPVAFTSRDAGDTGFVRIARVTAEEFGVDGSLRPWLTSILLIGASAYLLGWGRLRLHLEGQQKQVAALEKPEPIEQGPNSNGSQPGSTDYVKKEEQLNS